MDKLINTEHFKHRLEAAIKSNKEMDYLDFMRICYLLDTEPAAFDKEKVMDELHNAADLNIGDGLWHVELRDALEIVEKGGI